jgi:cystathionine beta-lyase/cystathionine gamma-synthase
MPTLPLRVRKAQENAIELVEFLDKHAAVSEVFYPGHGDNDPTGLVGTQMAGPGGILAFEVGSYKVAARVLAKVKVFTSAVSLGATDSLIQHPAGLTHRIVSEEARKGAGITDGLMRISVGIEDVADLIDDLSQALS